MDKANLTLVCRDPNSTEIRQTIGYVNVEQLNSTDSTVVSAFKDSCRAFAIGLNSLTTNSLQRIVLETSEDITSGS